MSHAFLQTLGLAQLASDGVYPSVYTAQGSEPGRGAPFELVSPIDGRAVATFRLPDASQLNQTLQEAEQAFTTFRSIPAPVRGELVRRIGNIAREHQQALAEIICLEAGKILPEAMGEVQEWIDICDFAVGLSRQLHGKTIASERPGHRMMEQWHPLGPIGIITAFNFPMAVWSWNAMIGLVCGNTLVFKPSEQAPLCALACQRVVNMALDSMPEIPRAVASVIVGDRAIGQQLAADPRLPLISATGSTEMGRAVGQVVAQRLGRSLLELGGNNAMIVAPSADLDLALRAIVFAAVGTAGQRCTSLRRVIAHQSILANLGERLVTAYRSLPIGNPTREGTLLGPLINQRSFEAMQAALAAARAQGGEILYGGERVSKDVPEDGYYVRPAIVRIGEDAPIVQQETFAPILYLIEYEQLEQAITIQNGVPQGLSSALFTENMREAETFLSPAGSDCGLANINIGTSGSEIGGAFGGEKDTGGGRESGSDAWKAYMRRTTNTINYGGELPLAQGIVFE